MGNYKFLFGVIFLLLFSTSLWAVQPYYSPDLDEDEFVDFNDFVIFAANWQQSGSGLDGDFDNSGSVDYNDISHFSQYWLDEVIYPPTAQDQNVILTQGSSVEIILDANDENDDVLNYFVIKYPANGSLVLDSNTATYTPFVTYDGNDSFTFLAYDGKYESNIATVALTVRLDTDGDSLSDYDEINGTYGYVTDPCDPNTDTDGMPDGWEIKYNGLNPTVDDGGDDADSDGLNNFDEYIAGTEPNVQDTDGDGILDGAEIGYGTSPTNPDSDTDGIEDGAEIGWGLNPLNPDTDGDDLNDSAEVTFNGSWDYNPVPPSYGAGDFQDYEQG